MPTTELFIHRTDFPIPIAQAYSKAWDEFNTRIKARHSIINMYINLSCALLGALIYTSTILKSTGVEIAYFAMPTIALMASGLLYVHDLSMNNLIRYMVCCEALHPDFPSYHAMFKKAGSFREKATWTGWGSQKYYYRFWQSFCIGAIFVTFSGAGFYLGQQAGYLRDWPRWVLYFGILVLALTLKVLSVKSRREACTWVEPPAGYTRSLD